MNSKQTKYNTQIEITDLISEAVENAVIRRNQSLQEDALLGLSDEEASGVVGGLITFKPICPPIIMGIILIDHQLPLA
ncbi:hypothetical protein H6G76_30145 [Nostoc sp. FACHB-152]|uniref:hypothetical protein n=1 Tax=unclassified Nostoc TaxID=2593658 RepID=UPI001686A3CA|nr:MULTISPECIES: hypothetical protein [unclassified Nostoc]MBD2451314.1 hypothetical protein [Nostoc sp. FACHB-152]MBD2471260.1 hypothetical protein [Nostoc sp. FACHB-145]